MDGVRPCSSFAYVAQGIASIAQACAALRHHPGELLGDIIADMERRPSEYERDDWTAVVWALTRLARSPGHLYARLAREVRPVTNELLHLCQWDLSHSCPSRARSKGRCCLCGSCADSGWHVL